MSKCFGQFRVHGRVHPQFHHQFQNLLCSLSFYQESKIQKDASVSGSNETRLQLSLFSYNNDQTKRGFAELEGGGGGGGLKGREPKDDFVVDDGKLTSSFVSIALLEAANFLRGFGGVGGGGGAGRSRCTGGVNNSFLSSIGGGRPAGVNNSSSGVLTALRVVAVEKPLSGDMGDTSGEPPLMNGMGKVNRTRFFIQSLKPRFPAAAVSSGLSTLVE